MKQLSLFLKIVWFEKSVTTKEMPKVCITSLSHIDVKTLEQLMILWGQ
jgi:hypothetical protein